GSGTQSTTEGPLQAGNYSFQATSTGDSNYIVLPSANESLTINQGTLTLLTAIHDAGGGAVTNALGESVYDTYSLSGTQPFAFTGTVNYTFNSNAAGSGTKSTTEGPLQAGNYSFQATSTGDSNYVVTASPVEALTINKGTLTLATVIDDSSGCAPTGALGESVYDTYSLSGTQPFAFTGTVNYTFDSNAAGSGTQSTTEGPLQAGNYSFQATSTGDSNYIVLPSANESLTINQGTLTLLTAIHDAGGGAVTNALGESVYDTYSLSGTQPFAFTGTVNYTFDSNAAGSGTQSTTEGPLQAGNYSFQATSTGDSNYIVLPSANESLTINQGTLTLLTAIHDAGGGAVTNALGESVYDTYSLSGTQPFAFAGTVNYTFDSNAAGSGTQSTTEGPLQAGNYSFQATSTGDSNYIVLPSANESLTINQGTLTLLTAIHDAGGGAVTNALGESVYDTYSLSGTQPFAFTGTVNYTFNSNAAGSGTQSTTEGPLQAGNYSFQASSTGDSNYVVLPSANESLTINQGTLTLASVIKDATRYSNRPTVLGASVYYTYSRSGTQPFAFNGTVNYTFNGGNAGSGAQSTTEG